MSYLSQIFWTHSWAVCTLILNNLKFLVCLSVCSSVEAVEGFFNRHHIWTCFKDLWRMGSVFLTHITHTDTSSISVEAVEGFLKRHHICTCYSDLWRMWRAFLIHPTHTDRSSIYVEDVEGFLNSHHTWTC